MKDFLLGDAGICLIFKRRGEIIRNRSLSVVLELSCLWLKIKRMKVRIGARGEMFSGFKNTKNLE
jgi:hypothetical protein